MTHCDHRLSLLPVVQFSLDYWCARCGEGFRVSIPFARTMEDVDRAVAHQLGGQVVEPFPVASRPEFTGDPDDVVEWVRTARTVTDTAMREHCQMLMAKYGTQTCR